MSQTFWAPSARSFGRAVTIVAAACYSAILLAAPPVVKTVPWVPSNPLIPHDTWSGKSITLKGKCDVQGSNIQYIWDFGDGSAAATGTVPNMYAVQATHTYSGAVGTVFSATLTINNTTTGETANKRYYVQIRAQTLEVEVNVAIDEALWYLYKAAARPGGGQYRWNNVKYGNHYANTTASAVQAYENNGHLEESQPDNPYSEAVRGGIDYLMTTLYRQAMSLQGGQNPDSNGNGSGLSVNSDRPIYETGAVMDALVASGTPDATARTGIATYVLGRRYQEIVQDMADMYAWGQGDASWYYGGWRYSWNGDSDNSAAQWGPIGMIAAERTPAHIGPGPDGVLGTGDDVVLDYWGSPPAWVKDRNKIWLTYSYNPAGYFGYMGTGPNRALSTGPCGMVQLSFDGFDVNESRWMACEAYVANNWASFITVGRDCRYYSYYAFAKAMRVARPAPVVNLRPTGLDWYGDNSQGLARILVSRQVTGASGGYWPYDGWPYVGEQTAAAWNVIILGRTLFESGVPVAVAIANPNPAVAGQTIQLDGSDSFHQNPSRLIDSWDWDLDNDGAYDDYSGPFVNVSWPTVGTYTVGLRVTDNGTPELAAVTTLTILVSTPPLAPTAEAGGPYNFCPGTKPWYLDGRGSVNPDEGQHQPGSYPGDTIQTYAWDLDGDGAYDDALGAQPDVTAFFTGRGPGSYLIQLKVTDTTATSFPASGMGDLSDTDTAVVVVRSSTDPGCACVDNLAARAKPGKVQLTWTHTGAHHYNIYRGTVSGGPYLKIASTTSTYSTYLDLAVVNGTTYYYVVREANILEDELCQSNQASATPRTR